MNDPRGARTLSPMPLILASLLCVPLVACQGKDPTPKSGSADRPLSLPKGPKPVNATAARPAPRGPELASPYRPWQPEGLDGAPPGYFEGFAANTSRPYEPVGRSGPSQYQGYRFRPIEPNHSGRPAQAPSYGEWDVPGGDPGGLERGERNSGYGGGYAQRGPRFRAPGERERDRWQPEERSPYGWPAYGQPPYPPFWERDVYGFEPGRGW